MPFDTPIGRYRHYLEIRLKELECARLDCHTRFKQNSPAQKFCSPECASVTDPPPPRIQQIFEEFRAFESSSRRTDDAQYISTPVVGYGHAL